MMYNSTAKFVIAALLVWFHGCSQHIGVNCNLNRLHSLLMRNSFPCAVNSLCMCSNNGNGTYTYKISCQDVWFYKFTGKFSHFSVRFPFFASFVATFVCHSLACFVSPCGFSCRRHVPHSRLMLMNTCLCQPFCLEPPLPHSISDFRFPTFVYIHIVRRLSLAMLCRRSRSTPLERTCQCFRGACRTTHAALHWFIILIVINFIQTIPCCRSAHVMDAHPTNRTRLVNVWLLPPFVGVASASRYFVDFPFLFDGTRSVSAHIFNETISQRNDSI